MSNEAPSKKILDPGEDLDPDPEGVQDANSLEGDHDVTATKEKNPLGGTKRKQPMP